jgi:hypothetical protein
MEKRKGFIDRDYAPFEVGAHYLDENQDVPNVERRGCLVSIDGAGITLYRLLEGRDARISRQGYSWGLRRITPDQASNLLQEIQNGIKNPDEKISQGL